MFACGQSPSAAGGWGRFCRTSGGRCHAEGACFCPAGSGTAACAPRGCSFAGRAYAAPGTHLGVGASLHRQAACTCNKAWHLMCLASQASDLHPRQKAPLPFCPGRQCFLIASRSLIHLKSLVIVPGRLFVEEKPGTLMLCDTACLMLVCHDAQEAE